MEADELEEPPEERLLPIGGVSSRRGRGGQQHLSLLDRVWQVLGTEQQEDCLPLVQREGPGGSRIKIATSTDSILETADTADTRSILLASHWLMVTILSPDWSDWRPRTRPTRTPPPPPGRGSWVWCEATRRPTRR